MNKNITRDVLSDMKVSLQHELLENENIREPSSSSLAAPLNKLCGLWLSEADELICVSKKQRKIIGPAMPEVVKKLRVIYNPLPAQPLVEKALSKQPSMLFLGRDSYLKGFNTFLNASYETVKAKLQCKIPTYTEF